MEDLQNMVLHVRYHLVKNKFFYSSMLKFDILLLFLQSWLDEFLKWEPKDYNNLESIILPASSVWTPDLHLINR